MERFSAQGHAEVPEGWTQGRTAYGGLSAAYAVLAARREVADLPALRSLQVNFTGPVTGAPEMSARLLRRGRNVASASVEGVVAKAGDATSVINALAVFGAARDSVLDVDMPAPDGTSAPEDADAFFPPEAARFAPRFFANFEVRFAGGHRPVSGAPEGRMLCWARHRDPAAHVSMDPGMAEAAFVCLGDVLPPSAFPMMRAPAPISSVNWTLNLLRPPDTREGWFLVETLQTAARDGYSSQRMRFWNTDGRMVADGMQAVAVFA